MWFFNFQKLWIQYCPSGLKCCPGSLLQRHADYFNFRYGLSQVLGKWGGWCLGFGGIHRKLKNIRCLVGILETLLDSLDQLMFFSGLGLTTTIYLNSSTIFLLDKLCRSAWLFLKVMVYFTSSMSFIKMRSFLENIVELSFLVSSTHAWWALRNEVWTLHRGILGKARVYTLKGTAVVDHDFRTSWATALCVQSTGISRDLSVLLWRLIAADQFSWVVL